MIFKTKFFDKSKKSRIFFFNFMATNFFWKNVFLKEIIKFLAKISKIFEEEIEFLAKNFSWKWPNSVKFVKNFQKVENNR